MAIPNPVSFTINGNTAPRQARPSARISRLVVPEPTGFDGLGRPCGAVGLPRYVARRKYITAAGHTWWMAWFVANPAALSVAVTNIAVYNPYYEAWQMFATGTMLRPKWESENSGIWYADYMVEIVNLDGLVS